MVGLPANNLDFSNGLSGYQTVGLVGTETQYVGRIPGQPYLPQQGANFVRLDDPRAVGDPARGNRLNPELSRLGDLKFGRYQNDNGTWTFGGDGAYLECQGVGIPAGRTFWLRYAFIAYDTLQRGANDFAVLLAYPNDDVTAPPVHHCLHDIRKLRASNSSALQTAWLESPGWHPTPGAAFTGTLRVVMMNGQIRQQETGTPTGGINARPSCLLIDALGIR